MWRTKNFADMNCFVLMSLLLPFLTEAVLPANYQSLKAVDKQNILWSQISANPYNDTYLPFNYRTNNDLTVFSDYREHDPNFLRNVFENNNDEMLPGHPKLVFPLGIAYKSEYVALPNPYTGLFQTGGVGVSRHGSLPPVIPTLAIKILVDGDISHNYFLAKDVVGEAGTSVNFFDQVLASAYPVDVPPENVIYLSHQAFLKTVSILKGGPLDRPINALSLHMVEHASVHNNGSNVTGPVIAPYQIRAVASGQVALLIDTTNPADDFRAKFIKTDIKDKLLYHIQAQSSPGCQDWITIGELYARSNAVSSYYEDQILFFRQPARQWEPSVGLPGGCQYKGVTGAIDLPETTVVDITEPPTTLSTAASFTQPAAFFGPPGVRPIGFGSADSSGEAVIPIKPGMDATGVSSSGNFTTNTGTSLYGRK